MNQWENRGGLQGNSVSHVRTSTRRFPEAGQEFTRKYQAFQGARQDHDATLCDTAEQSKKKWYHYIGLGNRKKAACDKMKGTCHWNKITGKCLFGSSSFIADFNAFCDKFVIDMARDLTRKIVSLVKVDPALIDRPLYPIAVPTHHGGSHDGKFLVGVLVGQGSDHPTYNPYWLQGKPETEAIKVAAKKWVSYIKMQKFDRAKKVYKIWSFQDWQLHDYYFLGDKAHVFLGPRFKVDLPSTDADIKVLQIPLPPYGPGKEKKQKRKAFTKEVVRLNRVYRATFFYTQPGPTDDLKENKILVQRLSSIQNQAKDTGFDVYINPAKGARDWLKSDDVRTGLKKFIDRAGGRLKVIPPKNHPVAKQSSPPQLQ